MIVESYRKMINPTQPIESPFYMPHIIQGRPIVIMERKEVVVGVALVTGALLLLIAAGLALYFCCKRRRKPSADLESEPPSANAARTINGFLTLKTPLISTKALG
ncbi:uncharacterized protein [Rhodnius prolixus]|uniref:uncharacterized protein n=1 Tax=Rhodnius prolixus TaxID=13249 RepID=UPI003D18B244